MSPTTETSLLTSGALRYIFSILYLIMSDCVWLACLHNYCSGLIAVLLVENPLFFGTFFSPPGWSHTAVMSFRAADMELEFPQHRGRERCSLWEESLLYSQRKDREGQEIQTFSSISHYDHLPTKRMNLQCLHMELVKSCLELRLGVWVVTVWEQRCKETVIWTSKVCLFSSWLFMFKCFIITLCLNVMWRNKRRDKEGHNLCLHYSNSLLTLAMAAFGPVWANTGQ